MIKEDFSPLVVLYGYRGKRNSISFVGRKGLITLSGKTTLIQKILRLCNGYNSVNVIARRLSPIPQEEVLRFLSLFESQGIICDSRNIYLEFHKDSSNPVNFSCDLGTNEVDEILQSERLRKRSGITLDIPPPVTSNVLDTIQERKSTRSFEKGPIHLDQLSGILRATYGLGKMGHWSVASGGGMYPLDLYLIVPDDGQPVTRGIYRWSPEQNSLTLVSDKNPSVWLSKVFNARTLLENAACILCIAADLKRSAMKYSNRGYRLTLLEAGHATQNAYLFCAEQGIGVVEYCGFSDEALTNELGLLFPEEAVLTTLVIGRIDPNIPVMSTDQEISQTADRLRHFLVGDKKPIRDVTFLDLKVGEYSMPLWSAMASYRPVQGRLTATMRRKSIAFSTGPTSSETLIKALAEGFERYALEQSRSDRKEAAQKLNEPFLDPRVMVPYSDAQYKNLKGLTRFDPLRKIDWVSGLRRVSGEQIWVPMELAYYATDKMKRDLKLCYQSSSSGVAAHFDRNVAIDIALCELIERDAFSVTWYSKRRVHSIPHDCLQRDLRDRISEWKRLGYNVSILDLTLDGPPVALVIIWSREKVPALCSGAACRRNLFESVEKAFNEAEFMAMTWTSHRPEAISIGEIDSPEGHGAFYLDRKNLAYADWLLKAEDAPVRTEEFNGDLGCYEPIIVDITPKSPVSGLSVVRVLSEKLMPINFGYGNEHRGHSRMDMLSFRWAERYPSTPHFFA